MNHIGKNYPCLEDTYHGIKSPRNTSYYSYSTSKTESTAEFYLDRLVNWGEFISVTDKQNLCKFITCTPTQSVNLYTNAGLKWSLKFLKISMWFGKAKYVFNI